jgi:serine/threonine-protein kinase RsbW
MIAVDIDVKNTPSIKLQNRLEDSIKLADFFSDYVKTYNIPDDVYNDLRLVLEEVFINITSYAYDIGDSQTITVNLNNTAGEISITFNDTGIAFDPLSHTTDNIETADHCEGGMGIHIIRSLTDHQQYHRVGQSNVFTVTKHYTKQNNE